MGDEERKTKEGRYDCVKVLMLSYFPQSSVHIAYIDLYSLYISADYYSKRTHCQKYIFTIAMYVI